jgi:hypothetical protein
MDSTKVFIDTDNEITFILEKILSAKSEKVSLVIPDRASVFSSVTGLKLIRRVVDKSNKLLVLVTLDEQGAELSRNAGLLVVSRVGEINDAIWEKALKDKFQVKKRDARSHYMPEAIVKEAGVESIGQSEDSSVLDISAKELDSEKEETAVQEENSNVVESEITLDTDENQPEAEEATTMLDVPQVRINIDMNELSEAEEELPESQDTIPNIEEPPMPSFLMREVALKPILKPLDAPDSGDLLRHDEHVEDIAPTMHNDTLHEDTMPEDSNENIRKRRVSTGSSSISNLSFSVGKDIENEKKK